MEDRRLRAASSRHFRQVSRVVDEGVIDVAQEPQDALQLLMKHMRHIMRETATTI